MFLLDTNLNEMVLSASLPSVASDSSALAGGIGVSTTLQLSRRSSSTRNSSSIADILWPTSVVAVIDTGSSTNNHALRASGGQSTTDTINYILYVTEYLGKVWRLKLTKSIVGTSRRVKYSMLEMPELLVQPLVTTAANTIGILQREGNIYFDVVE